MIPLFKVRISPMAAQAVEAVLQSGYIGQGPVVEHFETLLQEKLRLRTKPLTTNSCTSALEMSYRLIGIERGDRVIATPMTCLATIAPLMHIGAEIIWGDVDPKTGLLDPEDVANTLKALSRKPKAIVAVDWGGKACDYRALKTFGLPVVQDAAHATFALHEGKGHDYWGGDYVCFSFQAIKPLTTGDGGALVVPQEQYERARKLRWFGLDRDASASMRCAQRVEEVGGKYHMNDISAAIGISNLEQAAKDSWTAVENSLILDELIQKKDKGCDLELSRPLPSKEPRWLYTVLTATPTETQLALRKAGYESSEVHRRCDKHPATDPFRRALPGVDEFSRKQLNVPIGWWLEKKDLEKIAEALTHD